MEHDSKKLMSNYDDSSERTEIYIGALEFLTAGMPISTVAKVIDNHKKTHLVQKITDFYNKSHAEVNMLKNVHFREKLEKNKDFKKDVGLILVELIDKVTTDANVEILANLFVACADDQITEDQFIRLAITLQKSTYSDIIKLSNYWRPNDFSGIYESSCTDSLVAAGFLAVYAIGGGQTTYQLNNIGFEMVAHGLRHEYS